jgi:hypothetical protein
MPNGILVAEKYVHPWLKDQLRYLLHSIFAGTNCQWAINLSCWGAMHCAPTTDLKKIRKSSV